MHIILKCLSKIHFYWNRLNDFQQARIKLTGLYLFIVFIILNIFTISIFYIFNKEEIKYIKNIEMQWQEYEVFSQNEITIISLEKPIKPFEKTDLLKLQSSFSLIVRNRILWIEFLLILVAGIFSYFLSGKTLGPIEKKNKQQKQFLADVSHELKNPLSALQMLIDVSLKQKHWKQGEVKEVFSDIYEEISRLIRITEELLEAENNNIFQIGKKEKVNIDIAVNTIIEKLIPFARKKNIIFERNIQQFQKKIIIKDLEKVLFNIIHNAIKFSYPHSTIKISLLSKGKVIIEDFGVGIAKENLSKIFDRFYKAENSRSFADENGSGLGLFIVKKICDKNYWNISISSEEKKGTTVVIDFL